METGTRPVTTDIVLAYEKALGENVFHKEITHPGLARIKGRVKLQQILDDVENGEPGVFAKGPTTRAVDITVGSRLSPTGVRRFRTWMVSGATATLRTNALSVIAKLPGAENARLVAQVLEDDLQVRRLCLASDISRLTQVDWQTALRLADDVTKIDKPRRFAVKLTKEAVDASDSESRWCAAHMLRTLVPVLGK
ncbi:XRE family transcriptional regulator [Actinokineospora sp. G85]|uniref:XRE family transcriptional regulator n=1 Tax=Actinokineospora sp. G85 TaxID=3406626 RepID=UPI003C717C4B